MISSFLQASMLLKVRVVDIDTWSGPDFVDFLGARIYRNYMQKTYDDNGFPFVLVNRTA